MAAALTQLVTSQIIRGDYTDGVTLADPNLLQTQYWKNGTGSGQGNVYYERVAAAGSGLTTLDFYGTAVLDAFSVAIAMRRICGIFIKNENETPGAGITLAGTLVTLILGTLTSWRIGCGGNFFRRSKIGFALNETTDGGLTIQRSGSVDCNYRLRLVGSR